MENIKIILADDHQLVRDGIRSLLTDAKNIEIVDEASDGFELLEKLKIISADIIVLDVSMPRLSGIEATKKISEEYPEVKVLVLSMFTGEEFVFNAIKAAKDYDDLADRLAVLFEKTDTSEFRQTLERATFAADCMGFANA